MKTWRKYARRVALGGLALDLVALEERHLRQMGNLQDRLDAETVYLRHGGYFSARDPQIDCMVRKNQWNKDVLRRRLLFRRPHDAIACHLQLPEVVNCLCCTNRRLTSKLFLG